jgi:PTS system sucrose-specific IIC component
MLVFPALPNAYDVAYGNSSPIYVLGFILWSAIRGLF